jgi:hypothetical protein
MAMTYLSLSRNNAANVEIAGNDQSLFTVHLSPLT